MDSKQIASKLDTLSGYAFFLALLMIRLRDIPNKTFSAIITIVSLSTYLIGYSLWYIASLFYRSDRPKFDSWYDLTSLKSKFQASALIGVIATILSLAIPSLFIPTAWLFFISNIIWVIGEHHRLKDPPDDRPRSYSTARQMDYSQYTKVVCSVSFITAIAATSAIVFPMAAPTIILVSSIVGTGLTILTVAMWARTAFGDYTSDRKRAKTSHEKMSATLGSRSTNNSAYSVTSPGSRSGSTLFSPQHVSKPNNQNLNSNYDTVKFPK